MSIEAPVFVLVLLAVTVRAKCLELFAAKQLGYLHTMVVVEQHVAFLLIVVWWLKSNRFTAKIRIFLLPFQRQPRYLDASGTPGNPRGRPLQVSFPTSRWMCDPPWGIALLNGHHCTTTTTTTMEVGSSRTGASELTLARSKKWRPPLRPQKPPSSKIDVFTEARLRVKWQARSDGFKLRMGSVQDARLLWPWPFVAPRILCVASDPSKRRQGRALRMPSEGGFSACL